MDGLTMKVGLAIGALLLIGLLWVVWKFFSKVFKHVLILVAIGLSGVALFFYIIYVRYASFSPAPRPEIGKHAYMKDSGEYIGVVEAEGDDSRRGKVWIIRPLGGHPQKYSKARVTLKDKMELKPAPTPAPTSESKSDSDKEDKKVDTKKKKS